MDAQAYLHLICLHMSRIVRKPAFRICESKGADQLGGFFTYKIKESYKVCKIGSFLQLDATLDRQQLNMLLQSTNAYQKLLETAF